MRYQITVAAVIAVITATQWLAPTLSYAQESRANPPMSREAMRADAQKQWDSLRAGSLLSFSRNEALDRVAGTRSLPATSKNTDEIIALLKGNSSKEEKLTLIRLLGMQHLDMAEPASKTAIAKVLTDLVTSTTDRAIGNMAAVTYSRLGFFPDSLSIVALAKTRGFLTDNDYYRELVHLMPVAPPTDQVKILKELQAAQNAFSKEVVANSLRDRSFVASLSSSTAAELTKFLGTSEPSFPTDPRRLGGTDALRYEDWLFANAALISRTTGETQGAILSRVLTAEGIDPRKLISALLSEESGALVRSALDRKAQERVDASIKAYADANPSASWARDLADTARKNLAGTK